MLQDMALEIYKDAYPNKDHKDSDSIDILFLLEEIEKKANQQLSVFQAFELRDKKTFEEKSNQIKQDVRDKLRAENNQAKKAEMSKGKRPKRDNKDIRIPVGKKMMARSTKIKKKKVVTNKKTTLTERQ